MIREYTCSDCKAPKETEAQTAPLPKRCPECNQIAKKARSRAWYLNNPTAHRQGVEKWHKENPEKVQAKRKKWRKLHGKARHNWLQETCPAYRLTRALRNRIWSTVRRGEQSARTMGLLGCGTQELWLHLESLFQPGMTRENYGPVWHVDHKRPCASFDLSQPEQQRECFHFTNLQPLFAEDNLSKGAAWR